MTIKYLGNEDLTQARSVALGSIVTNTNFYVSPAGNDANDGRTVGTPWLTIQHALNTICPGMYPGAVVINLANGTYTEALVGKEIFGNLTTLTGASSVIILGNVADPTQVVIDGNGSRTFTIGFSRTKYTLTGLTLTNNGTSRGLQVNGGTVFLGAVNITNTSIPIIVTNYGYVEFVNAATGGNIDSTASGITCLNGGQVSIDRGITGLNITGITTSALVAGTYGLITGVGALNITAAVAGMQIGIHCDNESTITWGGAIHIIGATVGVATGILISGKSSFRTTSGASTVNLDACTNAIQINGTGILNDSSTGVGAWTYTNGTPATVLLSVFSTLQTTNASLGGTLKSYVDTTQPYTSGSDNRYAEIPRGCNVGALAVGATNYFGPSALTSTYFPLYISQGNEIVIKAQMNSVTGNGAAHTDVYTVVKNGVDTTMTFSVTNASVGSTTTNPVSLVAGDTVGIKVVTDAATAAADVIAMLKIVKA